MAIFAAMVDRMDQQIGRIVTDLEKRGELDSTLIVFTSDNGACAEWDPRGFDVTSSNQNMLHTGDDLKRMGGPDTYHSVGSGWANASNTPWRLYKHFNHEGGIASPGIIHWPDGPLDKVKGKAWEKPAHIIDLLPTFLRVAQLKDRAAGPLPPAGVDLLEDLQGDANEDRVLFFEHEGHRAVRAGKWKLVALDEEDWELYDFTVDRIETNNLARKHPEVVKKLSRLWEAWGKENLVTPLPKDRQVQYLKVN